MQKLELTGMQTIEGGQHLPNPIEAAWCEYAIEAYLSSPIFNMALFLQYSTCLVNGYGEN